jgi:hypothetical protein
MSALTPAMKRALIIILLLASTVAADTPPNPFASWLPPRIAKHRAKSKAAIKDLVAKWGRARADLIGKCRTCKGAGCKMVHSVNTGEEKRVPCPTCSGSGLRVNRAPFLLLSFEIFSPRYRTAKRRKALEQAFKNAQFDPNATAKRLKAIQGHNSVLIAVHGNFATVTLLVVRDGIGVEETHELIEDPAGTWCFARPNTDGDFARFKYPPPPPSDQR